MSASIQKLIDEGWPIDLSKLMELFGAEVLKENYANLRQLLLDADIRDYSTPSLSDHTDKEEGLLKKNIVLQIGKIRNVSLPKQNFKITKNGLLKVLLTDGHTNICAAVLRKHKSISPKTPPGTKVHVGEDLKFEYGMIVIDRKMVCVLGGEVSSLIHKWKFDQGFGSGFVRKGFTEAPPWVPFLNKELSASIATTNFSANDIIKQINAKTEDGNDEEFTASRNANIVQAAKEQTEKKFVPVKLNHEELQKATLNTKPPVKKERIVSDYKSKRKGRPEPEYNPVPSGPLVLSDFIQSKLPSTSRQPSAMASPTFHSTEVDLHEFARQSVERGNPRDRNGALRQLRREGLETSSADRSESSNRSKNFVPATSSNYTVIPKTRSFVRRKNAHPARDLQSEMKKLSIDRTPNQDVSVSRVVMVGANDQTGSKDVRRKERFGKGSVCMFSGDSKEYSFSSSQPRCTAFTWKKNDKCLAPWSDGQLYEAVVLSVEGNGDCCVKYEGYDEQATIPFRLLVQRL